MNTTTSFTLADAASGTGMLKSSILSAIKSCRLSGARGEFGQLRIEAEELHRELAETRTRASLAEQRVADLTAMLDDVREHQRGGTDCHPGWPVSFCGPVSCGRGRATTTGSLPLSKSLL